MRLLPHVRPAPSLGLGAARWLPHVQPEVSGLRHAQPLLSAASTLDNISALHALGVQGGIEATRDAIRSVVFALQTVAPPLIFTGLILLGGFAWQEGTALRERASTAQLSSRDFGKLILCLLVDLIGNGSLIVGDESDLLWAPLSALLLYRLFENPALALINGAKELLPLCDVLPVATLGWLLLYAYPDAAATRALGLRRTDDSR